MLIMFLYFLTINYDCNMLCAHWKIICNKYPVLLLLLTRTGRREWSPVKTTFAPPAASFFEVCTWLGMTFNYLILWVRVKGRG